MPSSGMGGIVQPILQPPTQNSGIPPPGQAGLLFEANPTPGWVKDAVLSLRSAVILQGGVLLGNKKDKDEVEDEPDFYQVLGASRSADEAMIKKHYRKLVLQWH